jgi:hypothetical protein
MARTGDGPDLPFRDRQRIVLVSATAPELIVGGPRYVPGAVIGDFVVAQGDSKKVFKGSKGFEFLLVGMSISHPEYLPRSLGGAFVCDHGLKLPSDAKWIKSNEGTEKTGHWRQNGNRVVPTITAYMLVEGHPAVYDFYSTAFNTGKDLSIRAGRVKAIISCEGVDGKVSETVEVKGYGTGKWLMISEIEKKLDRRYPIPIASLVGKLGDEKGPTLDEWRTLQDLRRAFKAGELDWQPLEAIEPPEPPSAPLAHERRGSIEIRSAKGGASRWDNDEVEDGGYPEGDDGPPWDDNGDDRDWEAEAEEQRDRNDDPDNDPF